MPKVLRLPGAAAMLFSLGIVLPLKALVFEGH